MVRMEQQGREMRSMARTDTEKRWRCSVCNYVMNGENPPKGCPKCGSPSGEFLQDTEHIQLTYDGKPFDVLLINSSTHRSGNTSYMTDIAEDELRAKGISCRRFNLNEYKIDHCWCCYSRKAEYCTYPCRNSEDDMPAFHQMIAASRAIIVASPINWNTMSGRLKAFLDRTTCLQNLYHLGKPGMTEGKILGILVNGHEDGAMKTAMDIHLHFQQMGFVLAPFGIAFRTHGAEFNSSTDEAFLRADDLTVSYTRGVVNNVIELMPLDIESQLRGKLVPVSE